MGHYLRQSTATTIKIGPLIDDTDFKTRETAVVFNQAGVDCAIMKNNGTWDVVAITDTGGANDWVNKGDGFYTMELTAAQTDTLGPLEVSYYATGILPWSDTFHVLPVNVYDSLFAGSDNLQVDLTQIGGVAQSATDLKDFVDTGYDPATHKVEGVKTTDVATDVTNQVLADVREVNNVAVAGINDFKADVSNLDVAVSTRLATAGYTAPDNAGIANIYAKVDTEVQAILDAVAALQADMGDPSASATTLLAELLAIKGLVDDLEGRLTGARALLLDSLSNLDAAVSTRLAAAGYTAPDNAGITNANTKLDSIQTDLGDPSGAGTTIYASILTRSTLTAQQVWEYGTRALTSFGTLVSDIWSAAGRTLTGFGTLVSDIWSNGVRTLTANPGPTAAQIADAVLDEAIADHLGAGTVGEAINSANAPTAGEVADAVWDEAIADHLGAGTTGNKLNQASTSGGTVTIETGTEQVIEVG